MIEDIRKNYLEILGKTYIEYSFPQIVGWIEGVLTLEDKPLNQTEISKKISEIIRKEDAPSSISSVSRALKIMESYGVVIKKGSRKIGFTYQIVKESAFIEGFLKNFINISLKWMNEISELQNNAKKKNDLSLVNAIETYIRCSKLIAEVMNLCLDRLGNEE